MKRIIITLTILAGMLITPATATATDNTWRARAIAALALWHAQDDTTPSTSVLAISAAGMAQASLNGWDDSEVATLLGRVMALRNPDGGWGLNSSFDAFGDKTVNPPNTTYTITLVDHVGPFLLGAYQHGLIGVEPLTTIGTILIGLPRWSLNGGICLPYSTAAADQVNSTYCVHNVNAAVGLFLTRLAAANVSIPGATGVRAGIIKEEVAAYNSTAMNWAYDGKATTLDDADHEALNVEAMLTEAPSLGYVPQVQLMTHSFPADANSPLAHWRLGYSRCVSADQWFGEFDAWLASPPAPADTRLAQMARYAARDAAVCEATTS